MRTLKEWLWGIGMALCEFLVMSFWLIVYYPINVHNLHELDLPWKLYDFMIYIDDMLVYFKTIKKHGGNLKYVLNKLQQNKHYINKIKNKVA